jgi:hypothetical protein
MRSPRRPSPSSIVALALLALARAAVAGEPARSEAVGLRFTVPEGWTRIPAASEMRAAQYRIPKASGDADDGEIVLFFFGPGQGGTADANLDRWYGQMKPADGRAARDAATVTIKTVQGLRITATDVSGTYSGGMGGGAPRAGMRLLAAVVEGEGGPWFWKAIGPEATMARAKPAFESLLSSLEGHR